MLCGSWLRIGVFTARGSLCAPVLRRIGVLPIFLPLAFDCCAQLPMMYPTCVPAACTAVHDVRRYAASPLRWRVRAWSTMHTVFWTGWQRYRYVRLHVAWWCLGMLAMVGARHVSTSARDAVALANTAYSAYHAGGTASANLAHIARPSKGWHVHACM